MAVGSLAGGISRTCCRSGAGDDGPRAVQLVDRANQRLIPVADRQVRQTHREHPGRGAGMRACAAAGQRPEESADGFQTGRRGCDRHCHLRLGPVGDHARRAVESAQRSRQGVQLPFLGQIARPQMLGARWRGNSRAFGLRRALRIWSAGSRFPCYPFPALARWLRRRPSAPRRVPMALSKTRHTELTTTASGAASSSACFGMLSSPNSAFACLRMGGRNDPRLWELGTAGDRRGCARIGSVVGSLSATR